MTDQPALWETRKPLIPPGNYICPHGCGAHIGLPLGASEPPSHLCELNARGEKILSRYRRTVTLILEGSDWSPPRVHVKARAVAAK